MSKKAIVLGAGGFIGNHMVNRLKNENYYVVGVDLKNPEFSSTSADEFYTQDLTHTNEFYELLNKHKDVTEIYQYAADMGGAGFIFTGDNDADIMHNSCLININLLRGVIRDLDTKNLKIFILVLHVFILKKYRRQIKILALRKLMLIQQIQILNMGGKNYFLKGFISLIEKITD